MLSKKTYVVIAKAIKESKTKDELVNRLCFEFKNDNPNFDSWRFRNAVATSESEVAQW